jgi:hypothetical protein
MPAKMRSMWEEAGERDVREPDIGEVLIGNHAAVVNRQKSSCGLVPRFRLVEHVRRP